MRKLLLSIFFLVSTVTFSNSLRSYDTIPYWKIYRNNILIGEGSVNVKFQRIQLYKKTIKENDTILVKYFEDTHCNNCESSFIIKTETGKSLLFLKSEKDGYHLKMNTILLKLMAKKYKTSILKIYYRKDNLLSQSIPLFEFEIK